MPNAHPVGRWPQGLLRGENVKNVVHYELEA
jgi:hypothetical protein